MSQHLTPAMLERYLSGHLAAEDQLMVMTHMAECDACRQMAESDPGVRARMLLVRERIEGADEHPDFDTLAGFVDGRLEPPVRASVEVHLSECAQCLEDVSDLRATQNEIAAPATTLVWSRARLTMAAAAAVLMATIGTAWVIERRSGEPAQGSAGTQARSVERFALTDPIGRVAVNADGSVTGLNALSSADASVVAAALTSGRLPVPDSLAALKPPVGPLMGAAPLAATFALTSPLGTVVLSPTPEFSWSAVPGATSYRVSVFDEKLNPVVESGATAATHWTPRVPLTRGQVYSWQVRASTKGASLLAPGPGSSEARLRVVDAETAASLDAAQRQYGSTPLVMGVLYARAGLIDDAAREFEAVQKANPDSPVAADLLRQVRKQ